MMMTTLKNVSRSEVRVLDIEPTFKRGFPGSIRVVRTGLASQPEGWPSAKVPLGFYTTDPPADLMDDGTCLTVPVAPVRDTILEPHEVSKDAPAVILYLEMRAPGKVHMDGMRVVYEAEGKTYHQVFPTEMKARVDRSAKKSRLDKYDVACLHVSEALPGWDWP